MFNAAAIHLVLDMATGKSDDGVNGHRKSNSKVKEAQRLWDRITKGEKIKLPDWSKKPGRHV